MVVNEFRMPRRHRERAEESVAAITHYLATERDPLRRMLLMRDYAHRSQELDEAVRRQSHARAVNSFLPARPTVAPRGGFPAQAHDVQEVDVLLLAIQPIELQAARDALGSVDPPNALQKDRAFYHCSIPSAAAGLHTDGQRLSIALTAVGEPLNLHTLHAVDEISAFYRADVWVLVGMAAGLPNYVKRGDVVLPRTVWWYEPGRVQPDMFEPRPQVATRGSLNRQLVRFDVTRPQLIERFHNAIRTMPERHRPDDLPADFVPNVSVLADAVATGDKLLRDATTLARLHAVNQHIVLGDQESYGFASACRDVNWMIARGIADFGDAKKDKTWQYLATLLAVHTVLEFLERDYISPTQ
jgi:nucleoside phosphorylase